MPRQFKGIYQNGVDGLIIWCFVLAGKGTGRFGEERRWKKRRRAK